MLEKKLEVNEMKHNKNPLRMNAKTTAQHPNHKRKVIACKICTNEYLKKEHEMIECPNCGLFTLILTDGLSLKLGAEIACTACHIHWARTNNW